MKKLTVTLFAIILILTGCGSSGKSNNNESSPGKAPAVIEANLEVPEKADVNKEVDMSVTVKQEEEFVNDADEVEFEIWKDGQKESSEMVKARLSRNGKYVISYDFKKEGIYNVQSHVTARDMHTMPKKMIEIGTVKNEAHEETNDEEYRQHGPRYYHNHGPHHNRGPHHNYGRHHNRGYHDNTVSIHFESPDKVGRKEPVPLKVHLEKDGQPLGKANVTLEIFQKGSNPSWINMNEEAIGVYKSEHQFLDSGEYEIIVHVQNKEGLHEHTEVALTVE